MWDLGELRGSLVVDVDGDGDAFGAGLKPREGGLLVRHDEGHVYWASKRGRYQQKKNQTEDQVWPSHGCGWGREFWRSSGARSVQRWMETLQNYICSVRLLQIKVGELCNAQCASLKAQAHSKIMLLTPPNKKNNNNLCSLSQIINVQS